MPFQKDDEQTKIWASEGGKAKAAIYELDRLQQDKMRKILDKDLEMVERIQNEEEIDDKLQKKLNLLKDRIAKYTDKLHPTKQTLGSDPDNPLVIKIEPEIANKYANRNTEAGNTGQPQV